LLIRRNTLYFAAFLKHAVSIHDIGLNRNSEMNRIITTLAIGTLLLTGELALPDTSLQKPAQNPTTGQKNAARALGLPSVWWVLVSW